MAVKRNMDPRSEMGKQIVQALAAGHDSKQIAVQQNLSKLTIDTYRVWLLRHTGARNTAELISYAYRHGILVDGEPHRLAQQCLRIIEATLIRTAWYEPIGVNAQDQEKIVDQLKTYLANG